MPPRINDEPEYGVPMDLAPMLPPVVDVFDDIDAHLGISQLRVDSQMFRQCEALLNAAVPLATELDEVKYILSVMVVAGSRLKLVQEGFSRGEFAIFEFGREDLTSYIEHYGSDLAQAGGLFVLRLGVPGAHVGDPV
ncbi:unnamed protein product, partial [Mesorhabditis spiculigera]